MQVDESERCRSPTKQVRFSDMASSAPPALHDYYGSQTLNLRAASAVSPSASPRSPLMRKFALVQDRRVNTILLESLQLVEFTKEELVVVEKSVKRLRDAIHGFAILVDKHVNIIGAESLEERGRVKADIQDLCENLKTSNALLDSTCARMKKHLQLGKNQIHAHKRKLVGKAAAELVDTAAESCAAHQCSTNDAAARCAATVSQPSTSRALYGISVGAPHSQTPSSSTASPSPSRPPTSYSSSSSPSCGISRDAPVASPPQMSRAHSPSKVSLAVILEPPSNVEPSAREPQMYLSPDFFASVSEAIGIREKEFLEPKDLARFVHEMLTFSIARSGVLTFMGKAHHRQLIPKYANELVRQILHGLQPESQMLSITTPVVVPQNTLFDYMCTEPFRFHRLLHGLHVANTNPSDGTSFFTAAAAYVADPIDPLTGVGSNPFAEQFSRNGGVLNSGRIVNLAVSKPAAESELLETAEQTLNIAKLLHDLATAESEAKHGNRISVRSPVSRSKEFSKVYIAASKELMLKEAGLG